MNLKVSTINVFCILGQCLVWIGADKIILKFLSRVTAKLSEKLGGVAGLRLGSEFVFKCVNFEVKLLGAA